MAKDDDNLAVDAMIEALWPQVELQGVHLNQLFSEASVEVDTPSVIALLLIWCESAKKTGMDKLSAKILLEKFFEEPGEEEAEIVAEKSPIILLS